MISGVSAVNPKALAEAIRNSAGPVPNVPASNPEWPTANSATWLDFFGKTVAEAVAGAIAAAHKDVVPKLLTQTRADNAKLAKTIRGANGDPADRLRTKLLYWNATLFSESRRQSYRLLSATDAAASAAFDLWGAVPDLHTLSVEYFLRETVRRAVGDSAATALVSLPNIASELQEENAIRADGDDDGGWSFRRTLRALADGTIDSASSYEQLGLPEQTRLSREDLAVWLFRDLQAERLSKWTS